MRTARDGPTHIPDRHSEHPTKGLRKVGSVGNVGKFDRTETGSRSSRSDAERPLHLSKRDRRVRNDTHTRRWCVDVIVLLHLLRDRIAEYGRR